MVLGAVVADETATADADGDVPAPPPAAPQYLVNGETCTKMAEDFIAICRFKEEAPAGSYTPCSYVEKWKIGRVRCLMEGMELCLAEKLPHSAQLLNEVAKEFLKMEFECMTDKQLQELAETTMKEKEDRMKEEIKQKTRELNEKRKEFRFDEEKRDLFASAALGFTRMFKRQLANGYDVNSISQSTGASLLYIAAHGSQTEIVGLLLDKGADPNLGNAEGETAMDLSGQYGMTDVTQTMMAHGAVMEEASDGYYALHRAAWQDHYSYVEALLHKDSGKYLELTSSTTGHTPLMVAAQNHSMTVLKFLLSEHADVNKVDKNGRSSLHLAVIRDLTETSATGPNDGKDDTECTTTSSYPAVKALLKAGANPFFVDTEGNSAYSDAVKLAEFSDRDVYYVLPKHLLDDARLKFGFRDEL